MWYSTANAADLNLVKEKQTRYSRNIVFLSLLRSSRPSNIIVITRTPFHWQWLSVWSTWENISEIWPQSDVGRAKHHYWCAHQYQTSLCMIHLYEPYLEIAHIQCISQITSSILNPVWFGRNSHINPKPLSNSNSSISFAISSSCSGLRW